MSLVAKLPTVISCWLIFLSLSAQHLPRCGTNHDAIYQNEAYQPLHSAQPRSVVFIPVVVHVVWKEADQNLSDEIIIQQIDLLNDDYNALNDDLDMVPDRFKKSVGNPNIRFCLAQIDPTGQATTGILRTQTTIDHIGSARNEVGERLVKHTFSGGSDAWNVSRYLNIWICDRNDFLGDATFPLDEDVLSNEDGVVIKFSAFGIHDNNEGKFNRGRTLTHEVAHYLNVFHLFGSETGCNNDDDLVSDTPLQSGPYFGCEKDEGLSSCGSRDMASNFLNFRDDSCMHFFTKGQVERMMDALFTYRFDLVNSRICSSLPAIPPDPLRVAQISTMNSGVEIRLRPLAGQEYQLSLFNLSGQRLWSEPENPAYRFSIDNVSMGIYVLVLDFDNRQFSRKIFIP